jgi:hypothetical protein
VLVRVTQPMRMPAWEGSCERLSAHVGTGERARVAGHGQQRQRRQSRISARPGRVSVAAGTGATLALELSCFYPTVLARLNWLYGQGNMAVAATDAEDRRHFDRRFIIGWCSR